MVAGGKCDYPGQVEKYIKCMDKSIIRSIIYEIKLNIKHFKLMTRLVTLIYFLKNTKRRDKSKT